MNCPVTAWVLVRLHAGIIILGETIILGKTIIICFLTSITQHSNPCWLVCWFSALLKYFMVCYCTCPTGNTTPQATVRRIFILSTSSSRPWTTAAMASSTPLVQVQCHFYDFSCCARLPPVPSNLVSATCQLRNIHVYCIELFATVTRLNPFLLRFVSIT